MAKIASKKAARKRPDPVVVQAIQALREGLEQMRAMQKKIEYLAKRLDDPQRKRKKPKR